MIFVVEKFLFPWEIGFHHLHPPLMSLDINYVDSAINFIDNILIFLLIKIKHSFCKPVTSTAKFLSHFSLRI